MPSPFLPYIDKKSQRLSFPVRNGLFAQGTSAKFLCSLIPPQDQFAKQTFIKKTPRRSSWCFFLVRLKGLEPTRIAAREPKSRMSTNSITGANRKRRYWPPLISLYFDTGRFPRRSKTLYPRTVTNGTIILPQPRRLDKWANANAAQNFLVHAN